MIKRKVIQKYIIQMKIYMRENLKITKKKVMEYIIILMEINTVFPPILNFEGAKIREI